MLDKIFKKKTEIYDDHYMYDFLYFTDSHYILNEFDRSYYIKNNFETLMRVGFIVECAEESNLFNIIITDKKLRYSIINKNNGIYNILIYGSVYDIKCCLYSILDKCSNNNYTSEYSFLNNCIIDALYHTPPIVNKDLIKNNIMSEYRFVYNDMVDKIELHHNIEIINTDKYSIDNITISNEIISLNKFKHFDIYLNTCNEFSFILKFLSFIDYNVLFECPSGKILSMDVNNLTKFCNILQLPNMVNVEQYIFEECNKMIELIKYRLYFDFGISFDNINDKSKEENNSDDEIRYDPNVDEVINTIEEIIDEGNNVND